MKKVLITGSTASQSSPEAHKRLTRFSGLLAESLELAGADVTFAEMSVGALPRDIEKYDSVVVGLAPISSLSAHRMYSALVVLGHALEQGKATLLFDAPEPHVALNSFKYVLENPSSLVKSLYQKRHGYWNVKNDFALMDSMLVSLEKISYSSVPTIVPGLPYYSYTRSALGLPHPHYLSSLYQYNFDVKFRDVNNIRLGSQSKYWLSENPKHKWSKSVGKTLSKPVLSLRRNAYDTNWNLIDRLHSSYGVLFNTYRDDIPWWSSSITLSFTAGVPVFSDWKVTSDLGNAWVGLPQNAEDMTHEERVALAVAQASQYFQACPDFDQEASKAYMQIVK